MAHNVSRLLVIEDNDGDLFLIEKAIRDYNIQAQLTVCTDGEAAVRLLDSVDVDTRPDAIIVDLALPRIEGLDVLRAILSRPVLVGTPIMIFTSSPSPSDKHRVELLGGARYVQKPSGVDTFLRSVGENVQAMLRASDNRTDGKRLP